MAMKMERERYIFLLQCEVKMSHSRHQNDLQVSNVGGKAFQLIHGLQG